MFDLRVVIRGGGDLGSGVALRLARAGFAVAILETVRPVAVRRTVSFSEAVYEGETWVEDVRGVLVERGLGQVAPGTVAVLVDPAGETLPVIRPDVLVDAILAKRNTGTRRHMARFTVGLGPGFAAPGEVHVVVETNRGPNLGHVIRAGRAQADTRIPGEVGGRGAERVLRAPVAGRLRTRAGIGDIVEGGEVLAEVGGEEIRAPFRGLVRGLLRTDMDVREGMKVGDLDPRLDRTLTALVSDKSRAVADGVLGAVQEWAREGGL